MKKKGNCLYTVIYNTLAESLVWMILIPSKWHPSVLQNLQQCGERPYKVQCREELCTVYTGTLIPPAFFSPLFWSSLTSFPWFFFFPCGWNEFLKVPIVHLRSGVFCTDFSATLAERELIRHRINSYRDFLLASDSLFVNYVSLHRSKVNQMCLCALPPFYCLAVEAVKSKIHIYLIHSLQELVMFMHNLRLMPDYLCRNHFSLWWTSWLTFFCLTEISSLSVSSVDSPFLFLFMSHMSGYPVNVQISQVLKKTRVHTHGVAQT